MTTFVALYRGQTVAGARLVAVSADPQLVGAVASELLQASPARTGGADPVLSPLIRGRRAALCMICREAADAAQ